MDEGLDHGNCGRAVTVTRGVRDQKLRGLTYGRVGVINFAHTHACERDREGKKEACELFLLYTTQNVWADFLTPTRVTLIGVQKERSCPMCNYFVCSIFKKSHNF